jgi:hypothetical protein
VEDGLAFCPQCNAPQIRVAGAEALAPAPEFTAAAQVSPAAVAPSTGIQWSQAVPAAALAGLLVSFAIVIPLGAFGVGMAAAGVLSVLLYRRRIPSANLTPAMGARLGAASGALGFGIFAVLAALQMLVFRSGGQIRAALLEAIQQSAARSTDPQAQQAVEFLKSPQGFAVIMVVTLIVVFVVFVVLSSLGGALGAVLLRAKRRP